MKKFNSAIIIFTTCIMVSACDIEIHEGTISLRGNEPHTQLVLMTSQGTSYELTGNLVKELAGHQYRKVVVRGRLISKSVGPGFPAKLEVDKIIEVKNR